MIDVIVSIMIMDSIRSSIISIAIMLILLSVLSLLALLLLLLSLLLLVVVVVGNGLIRALWAKHTFSK